MGKKTKINITCKKRNMKNIKIRIKDDKHSIEVQKVLFDLGCEWAGIPEKEIKHIGKPFLYVSYVPHKYWLITYDTLDNWQNFDSSHKPEVTLEDLKQMLKEKTMEQDKRPVQITKEQAQEMIESGCEISKRIALDTYPELEVKKLPKCWEDLESVSGYYIDDFNRISYHRGNKRTHEQHKNTLPNANLTKVQQVQPELVTMRNIYRDGWKPNPTGPYWTVYLNPDQEWLVGQTYREVFSFPSKEVAEEFLENFEEQLDVWAKIYY